MDIFTNVSENSGIPKSSILIGFCIISHPFWGYPYFWKHPYSSSVWLFCQRPFLDVFGAISLENIGLHWLAMFLLMHLFSRAENKKHMSYTQGGTNSGAPNIE